MADIKYATEWLEYAQRDYDFALDVESHFWPKHMEKICYNCQQVAEKALKAVLAYHEVEIPKTHNIERLFDECNKFDTSLKLDEKIAGKMTDYATISRYPDRVTMWTEADAKLALKYAKRILDMVKQSLNITEEETEETPG